MVSALVLSLILKVLNQSPMQTWKFAIQGNYILK